MPYSVVDNPVEYFNTKLYTGTGSARTITGVGFQPDWVWVKDRTSANYHYLYDVLRGNNLNLFTNDTSAEVNVTTGQNGGGIGSQASDGFTIVAGLVGTNNINTNTNLYASWNWKANGTGVSNTAGTISSTVSANTTSGFSIVSYTGTGANATVGHGLGVAPKMVICKTRNTSADWYVYHASMGTNKNIYLNSAGASITSNLWWNNTAPTSTVFSVGDQTGNNGSGITIIAYCFAEVKGYSKFGSYTGNGSTDGTFIYTGFSPAFVMVKSTSAAGTWCMFDNKRSSFNEADEIINAEDSVAEFVATGIDFTSNGFKHRNLNTNRNESGVTYIYMAFAQNPFVSSKGIPTTAR